MKGNAEKLSRSLRGDLDAVILKALRKEPEKRYQTVAELAEDIRRYLDDEPVSAIKGSTRYKARKFLKRRTGWVAGIALATTIILGLIVGLFFEQRETARQRDAANLAAIRSKQLSTFLISIFDLGDPFRHLTTPPTLSDLLAQSVRQLRSGKLHTPEDKVLFSETLARIYSAQGNYKMSLSLYEDALEEARAGQINGDTHRARLLTEIAATHIDLGQLPQARRGLNQARILQQSASSIVPADTARRLLISGRERAFSGAFIDATRFFSSALPLVANTAEEQVIVATIHEELALSLGSVGQYEEAVRNANKALDIAEHLYQSPHPAIAKILMSRAKIFGAIGRYEEASKDLREAEVVLSSSLGPNHPAVSDVLEDRGSLAIEQQNFDRAIRAFTKALELRTRILGPKHLETLRAYQRLGEAIQGKGDLPRAEIMLRKALADHERFGGDGTSISLLLNNLGLLLLQRGNIPEARSLLERALHIRNQMHGRNSAWVAVAKANLSNLYDEEGKRQAALEELTESIQIMKRSLGSQHYYAAIGLNNLGYFHADRRDYSSAIKMYREALLILKANNLEDSLLSTYLLTNLGDALLETGKLQEAYGFIQRAQKILHSESDQALPQRDVADGIEGKYLLLRGSFPEAEMKLMSSYEGLRQKTGSHSRQTQAALTRLILLYSRWGKPEKAAEYRKLLATATPKSPSR